MKKQNKSVVIQVRVSVGLKARLEREASALELDLSAYTRSLVIRALARLPVARAEAREKPKKP